MRQRSVYAVEQGEIPGGAGLRVGVNHAEAAVIKILQTDVASLTIRTQYLL